jgi:hypothetical protein
VTLIWIAGDASGSSSARARHPRAWKPSGGSGSERPHDIGLAAFIEAHSHTAGEPFLHRLMQMVNSRNQP